MLEITLNQMADAFAPALAADPAFIKKSLFHDFQRGVFAAARAKPKPAIFSGETVAAVLLAYATFPNADRPMRRAAVGEIMAARVPSGGEWELHGLEAGWSGDDVALSVAHGRASLAGKAVDVRAIAHAIPRALAGEEITLIATDYASDAEGVAMTRMRFTFDSVPPANLPDGVAEVLEDMRGWRVLRTVTVPAGELIRLALAEIAGTDA